MIGKIFFQNAPYLIEKSEIRELGNATTWPVEVFSKILIC